MSRTRAERRHNDWKKAIRKRKLTKEVYWHPAPDSEYDWEWYNNLHQYSKNKIHCSCPMCRAKTKDRARMGKYYDPVISERRRIDEMNYELWEEIE